MENTYKNESLMEMFVFEASQLIEQLEQLIITNEKSGCFTQRDINEVFRIMHTIKGSSAMMVLNNISALAHSVEDLFYFLREEKPTEIDCSSISDIVLEGVDFIKSEVEKLRNGEEANSNAEDLICRIKLHLGVLKDNHGVSKIARPPKNNNIHETCQTEADSGHNAFSALLRFEEGCEMENIRAYSVIYNLAGITSELSYFPEDIMDNENTSEIIREAGFRIYLKTCFDYDKLHEIFMQTIFLKDLELKKIDNEDEFLLHSKPDPIFKDGKEHNDHKRHKENKGHKVKELKESLDKKDYENEQQKAAVRKEPQTLSQSVLSVSVSKVDRLLDLVGEMVIAEAMVIQNPDLKGLNLEKFHKAARHLNKITSEIQSMVMSIRMVSISTTFHKMHRIVRDMCKKLDKDVNLEIIGEETEVDKNIIEQISDPLIHIVRNSLDHGIESSDKRILKGKPSKGTITLEAKNAGNDVLVIIKDDGRGLDKEKILKKAEKHGLVFKPSNDMSDKEIFNLIFMPGFSTKESVTEFSGRGVGMDIVTRNIEGVGGMVSVDSVLNEGTTITMKIPLTLAIIDGMNIKVGEARYTIPTASIKQSFRPKENEVFKDPDDNEMIMIRGKCYPIVRLYTRFMVETLIKDFSEGIIIVIEQDEKSFCIFADELLGQQQVVVKALPDYIMRIKKIKGLAGCTLLGDGNISLILDIATLFNS